MTYIRQRSIIHYSKVHDFAHSALFIYFRVGGNDRWPQDENSYPTDAIPGNVGNLALYVRENGLKPFSVGKFGVHGCDL
jgi:hypothetical protein